MRRHGCVGYVPSGLMGRLAEADVKTLCPDAAGLPARMSQDSLPGYRRIYARMSRDSLPGYRGIPCPDVSGFLARMSR